MMDTIVIRPPSGTQHPKLGSQYDDLARYVNGLIHECEQKNAVSFSQAAKTLILTTLVAITQDPSPRWQLSKHDLDNGWSAILKGMPESLEQLVSGERKTKQITYFQVLHWLGVNLDTLCPFPK